MYKQQVIYIFFWIYKSSDFLCKLTAVQNHAGTLLLLFWTWGLSFYLFLTVFLKIKHFLIELIIYIIVYFSVNVLVVIPLIGNTYGMSGYWCWYEIMI